MSTRQYLSVQDHKISFVLKFNIKLSFFSVCDNDLKSQASLAIFESPFHSIILIYESTVRFWVLFSLCQPSSVMCTNPNQIQV